MNANPPIASVMCIVVKVKLYLAYQYYIYVKMLLIPVIKAHISHDPLEIILIWWFDAQETFLIVMMKLGFFREWIDQKNSI